MCAGHTCCTTTYQLLQLSKVQLPARPVGGQLLCDHGHTQAMPHICKDSQLRHTGQQTSSTRHTRHNHAQSWWPLTGVSMQLQACSHEMHPVWDPHISTQRHPEAQGPRLPHPSKLGQCSRLPLLHIHTAIATSTDRHAHPIKCTAFDINSAASKSFGYTSTIFGADD